MLEYKDEIEFVKLSDGSFAKMIGKIAKENEVVCCHGELRSFDPVEYKNNYGDGEGCKVVEEIFRIF